MVWNKACFVPGELFIEFLPLSEIDLAVYLAILSSSITEVILRIHAQVYGGGTYNINPGEVRKAVTIDADRLANDQKRCLHDAYTDYLLDSAHDRSPIDTTIHDILGFNQRQRTEIQDVLEDLRQIAVSSKKRSSTHL